MKHIERILGLTQEWAVALVGVGPLGLAIARYEGFRQHGIRIAALFDSDPSKIGTEIEGLPVLSTDQIDRVVHEHSIKLAIIAVPAEAAQSVADAMIAAGVRAFLNYAPVVLLPVPLL